MTSMKFNYLQEMKYVSWKGTDQTKLALLPSHTTPYYNGDPNIPSNETTTYIPRTSKLYIANGPHFPAKPLKHYRYSYGPSRVVKSAKHKYLIDKLLSPGGSTNTQSVSDSQCNSLQASHGGFSIANYFHVPNSMTEVPPTNKPAHYCTAADKARRRVRTKASVDKTYYQTKHAHLENRCQLFKQRQYNFLNDGDSTIKPGEPGSEANTYLANCPSSSKPGCSKVVYKPNNWVFGVQGSVSSSCRLAKLKYDNITCNGATFTSAYGRSVCSANQYVGAMTMTADTPYTLKLNVEKPLCTTGSVTESVRRAIERRSVFCRQHFEGDPTVPNRPLNVSAIGGDGVATIYFSAPDFDGGADILSYTVTSIPDYITFTGFTTSPITLTGLTNYVPYVFTVVATNRVGNSLPATTDTVIPAPEIIDPSGGMLTAFHVVTFYDNSDTTNTTFNNPFNKICTDSLGNYIVAAYSRSDTLIINQPEEDGIYQNQAMTKTFVGTDSVTQSSTTYSTYNIAIIKYSSTGTPEWEAQIGGDTNKGNTIYDLTADSNGNIYALVGHAQSTVTYYNADETAFGSITNNFKYGNFTPARYCLIKYNSSGQIQWINSITAGDNNNEYLLINAGNLIVDNDDNVYVSCQILRAGGGDGPSSIKFYKYDSVVAGVVQMTLVTSDSYAFGLVNGVSESHRGMLIKIVSSTGNYDWISRIAIPSAYGEQNGGSVNGNMVVDSDNNIYLCLNSNSGASSPTCNIYDGISMTASSPLPALTGIPYTRLDLRGNSYNPSLPQFHRFVAIVKYNSSGVYQCATTVHQLINLNTTLNMNGMIGIDKITDSIYMTFNAQGFVGTNSGNGDQLDKLYIDNFSSNNTNGSNRDVFVTNAFYMTLAQPQTIMAIVKYDTSLQAQSMAYIDTPGGNTVSRPMASRVGNVYVMTTIKDNTGPKTVYTFNSINGSNEAVFDENVGIIPENQNKDGFFVSFTRELNNISWVVPINTSDNLDETGFMAAIDTHSNVYIGGNAIIDKTATSNFLEIYNYEPTNGDITLFGNVEVTNATDRIGFVVKYGFI